jgi:general secretion pathway protein M
MNLMQRRAAVTVAATAAAAVALAALAGYYVWREHRWAAETLQQVEPRYARLLGLRDAAGAIEESLKRNRDALAKLGYPADRDTAQLGNDLQQLARKALQAAGVTVASSQVLTPRTEGGLERVLVSLQGEGPLSGVQLALAALQAERPRIAFDSVLLQSTGRTADDGTPIVSCRLTVAVLRLLS